MRSKTGLREPDHWLFIAFCTLFLWAPIPLGSHRPWSSGLLAFAFGALALATLYLYSKERIRPSPALQKARWIVALFFLIPLWTLLQTLPLPPALATLLSPKASALYGSGWHPLSLDVNASFYKLQKSLCYALVFTLSLQLVASKVRLQRFAQILVLSGILQALYGTLVLYGGSWFDLLSLHSANNGGNATGTFVNRNHLAGYLEMTLAVGIGLLVASLERSDGSITWRERARRLLHTLLGGKAMLRLFLAVMVIALVLTHSRMGNSAFFFSLGISGMIGLLLFRKASRSAIILFSSLIVIDLFIVGAWFGVEQVAQRIESTDLQVEARSFVNAQSQAIIGDYLWSGSGAGSFYSTFPTYRTGEIAGFFDFAHNDYLQIVTEYGLPGALLFAAIALLGLYNALQAQRERRTPLYQGMGFAAMMGMLALLIHSWTDFNLHIPANAALFTCLCALAFVARHADATEKKRRRRSTHASVSTFD